MFQFMAVSLDRYLAICHPIYYHNRDAKFTKIMLSICWLAGLAIGSRMIYLNSENEECSVFFSDDKGPMRGFEDVTFAAIITAIVFIILYILIFRAIVKQV
jgi:hypothetical protein